MKTRDQSRLASLLSLLVGIWVALSPIWMTMSAGAIISTIITGLVIIAASLVQYFTKNTIPSWIMGAAAVWLFISTLTFTMSAGAVWSGILSAIATAALAYWDGFEATQGGTQTHRMAHQ